MGYFLFKSPESCDPWGWWRYDPNPDPGTRDRRSDLDDPSPPPSPDDSTAGPLTLPLQTRADRRRVPTSRPSDRPGPKGVLDYLVFFLSCDTSLPSWSSVSSLPVRLR